MFYPHIWCILLSKFWKRKIQRHKTHSESMCIKGLASPSGSGKVRIWYFFLHKWYNASFPYSRNHKCFQFYAYIWPNRWWMICNRFIGFFGGYDAIALVSVFFPKKICKHNNGYLRRFLMFCFRGGLLFIGMCNIGFYRVFLCCTALIFSDVQHKKQV